MLTIRLRRIGKKNQPSFRIVVVDKRVSASAGKSRDEIGFVDRINKKMGLNKEKAAYWLSKGAQPSPSVRNIFIEQELLKGKKIAVHAQPKKKEGGAEPEKPAVAATTEKPAVAEPEKVEVSSEPEKPVTSAAEPAAPAPIV